MQEKSPLSISLGLAEVFDRTPKLVKAFGKWPAYWLLALSIFLHPCSIVAYVGFAYWRLAH
jgi:hypothetical protein